MNIYDVSKKAGVSIATVSRVLNGGSNVSAKTKQKVLKVIEDENYEPNIFARSLGLNTMRTVGILCSNSSDIFLASAVYLLQQGLSGHGYDTLLCCTGYETENKTKYLDLLVSKRVDAIILVGSDFANEKDNSFIINSAKKAPIFLLNSYIEAPNVYSVLCDDEEIVFKVTEDLIKKTNGEIIFLTRRNSYSSTQKQNGFVSAFKKYNKALDSRRIITFDGDTRQIVDMLANTKNSGIKFSAVITGDDELAIGVIKYAKTYNISIPNKLKVIGYNNSRLTQYCEPELSSIDNKLESCCELLVLAIINSMNDKSVPAKTTIAAELINRQTT